jgi:hypothetical protein
MLQQVYDLLLVRTLYVTTKFMICCWSEHCMLWPSLWFVTGQNAVCYDQFMICYWSEHCMVWPNWWFVTGQNTVWYDQVYDLLPVRTLYATSKFMICYRSKHYAMTKFMICYWSEHCMLRPSLWFLTGQNTVYYDQVYDLLLFRTPYVTISNSYI